MAYISGACIAFAADDPYALPLTVAGLSLMDCTEPLPDVKVFDLGLTELSRDLILKSWPRSCDVEFLQLPDGPGGPPLPRSRHYSAARLNHMNIYARWSIPRALAGQYERVVYLDADLLVLSDLTPLCGADLGGRPFGAVQDYGIPYVSSDNGVPDYARLGLPSQAPYFNSGVLVIDIEQWLEHCLSERALAYAREHPEMNFLDQEALNAVAGGLWTRLSAEWNFPVRPELLPAEKAWLPHVLHFIGRGKPWLRGSPVARCQQLYTEYLQRTLWKSESVVHGTR